MHILEFEKPIIQIIKKINTLKNKNISTNKIQIEKENNKLLDITNKIYNNLSDWQIIQIARHPDRPHFLDLLNIIFNDFQELHGDRNFGDDKAVIGGLGKIHDKNVMIIGQEKGRKTKDKIKHNFGMMHPEGYRKALRLMKLAEKFNIPIITFIDTPGAYPGIQAEQRGQSEAIARNLFEMSTLNVPMICIIIGEGCSGGALGIGMGDKLIMLEYSYFATISPEGCASILWKTNEKAEHAAEIMGITAQKLKKLNIIDDIIAEPSRGAHNDLTKTGNIIKDHLYKTLNNLSNIKNEIRKN